MNVTVDQQPDCKASVQVELPAGSAASEREKIFKSYRKQAKLPGFRPGKAPLAIVEKRFGKNIDEELNDRLVQTSWQEAVKQEELKVLSIQSIDDPTLHDDGRFTFTAQISTVPEFELPDYEGIGVQLPKLDIGEKQIDQSIEGLRERFAEFKDVDDRALKMGDIAVIDYDSTLDGKPLAEAAPEAGQQIATGKEFWLKLDEEGFLPGFCNGLVDARIDETKEITVVLDDEFPMEDLRGKDLVYTVVVKGLKEQALPEVNEEFAEKVQPGSSLEQLRESIQADLQSEWTRQLDVQKSNQIISHLDSAIDFEIPTELLKEETERRANEIAMEAAQGGMEDDKIMSQQEEILDAAGEQARLRVKTSFILDRIAQKEEIEVTNQELSNAVMNLANRANVPPKQYAKQVQKDGRIPQIAEIIRTEKALELLKEKAVVEEVEPPEQTEEAAD